MLTGFELSFLADKCVFQSPEYNVKGRPRGIEF